MHNLQTKLDINGSDELKTVLVLGGYGAVGNAVCEELVRMFDGRIVLAGRNLRRAEGLARASQRATLASAWPSAELDDRRQLVET